MNDQKFFDLGIQVIAGRANSEEKAALDAELARHPEWKARLDQLRDVSTIAGETAQLAQVMENPVPAELPGYAHRRLQENLKKTFPTTAPTTTLWERVKERMRRWRWAMGATSTAAVIALFVVIPLLNNSHRPDATRMAKGSAGRTNGGATVFESNDIKFEVNRQESPVIQLAKLVSPTQTNSGPTIGEPNNESRTLNRPKPQVILLALLDSVGQSRGVTMFGPTDAELATTLTEALGQTNLTVFSETLDLQHWLEQWPNDRNLSALKIWYDRDAHEIRAQSRSNNIIQFEKVFPVEKESDLPTIINNFRLNRLH